MSDDPLESIWELHDELARAAEPFEKADRNRTSVSAADPTGTVRAKPGGAFVGLSPRADGPAVTVVAGPTSRASAEASTLVP